MAGQCEGSSFRGLKQPLEHVRSHFGARGGALPTTTSPYHLSLRVISGLVATIS